MNQRFPLLSSISSLLRFLGVLLLLAGGFYAVYEGILEPNQPGRSFAGSDLLQIITGACSLSLGLVIIGFAEVIGVLFAIEDNTYRAAHGVARSHHSATPSNESVASNEPAPLSSVNRSTQ